MGVVIPRQRHADELTIEHVNEVERALGLPPSNRRRGFSTIWDAIAHECHLPDTEQLRRGMDGPGIDVLPAAVWNLAVDEANRRMWAS